MARKDTQFSPSPPATSPTLCGSLLLSLGSPKHFFLFLPSWYDLFLNNPFMPPALSLFSFLKHSLICFPGGSRDKEPSCQCRRCRRPRSNPWAGKIPWRRAWQPTPVFLPGESHGQRSLAGCRPWGHRVRHDSLTYTLICGHRFLLAEETHCHKEAATPSKALDK